MLGLLQERHFQDHSVGGKDELLILVDKYLENFIIEINNFLILERCLVFIFIFNRLLLIAISMFL